MKRSRINLYKYEKLNVTKKSQRLRAKNTYNHLDFQ